MFSLGASPHRRPSGATTSPGGRSLAKRHSSRRFYVKLPAGATFAHRFCESGQTRRPVIARTFMHSEIVS
jgi:hypothetical protein